MTYTFLFLEVSCSYNKSVQLLYPLLVKENLFELRRNSCGNSSAKIPLVLLFNSAFVIEIFYLKDQKSEKGRGGWSGTDIFCLDFSTESFLQFFLALSATFEEHLVVIVRANALVLNSIKLMYFHESFQTVNIILVKVVAVACLL